MAEKKTENKPETAKREPTFTKAKILTFQKYAGRRDLLSVLLEDKSYTLAEVDGLVRDFMEGGVR